MKMEIDEPITLVKNICAVSGLEDEYNAYTLSKVDKKILLIGGNFPLEKLAYSLSKIKSIGIDGKGVGYVRFKGCLGEYSLDGWKERE